MKENIKYLFISIALLCCTLKAESQQIENVIPKGEISKMENHQEIEDLIYNAEVALGNSNFYDETIDSWWHTKEYWSEGKIDGVRSVILYTIIDSSQVTKNIELLLKHQFEIFTNHSEVSSLINKTAILFPDETLQILNNVMSNYKAKMKIFDPYGDHICKNLYEKLEIKNKANLDQIIVQLLNEESINFNNWFPIFRLFVEHGQNEKIKILLENSANKLKGINEQIYFNAIIQAKAKLNGFSYYEKLIDEVYEYYNKKDKDDQYRYYSIFHGIKAVQIMVDNSEISHEQRKAILNDLSQFKLIMASDVGTQETIEKIKKQLE